MLSSLKFLNQFLSTSLLTRSPNKTVVLRSYWRFHQLIDPTASEKATINNVFWIGIPRLYILHAAHVFMLKIYFDGVFLAINKNVFRYHTTTSRYYDGWKILLESNIVRGKMKIIELQLRWLDMLLNKRMDIFDFQKCFLWVICFVLLALYDVS